MSRCRRGRRRLDQARKSRRRRSVSRPPAGYRHDRIRVGYMSSDFCSHAMSYLIAELFERHDRSRFEIYGYCTSPEDGSDIRQRVIAAFDHFTIIKTMSDEQAARAIRADEIDILIDLNGLTVGHAHGNPALAAGAGAGDLSGLHRPGAAAGTGFPALRRLRHSAGLRGGCTSRHRSTSRRTIRPTTASGLSARRCRARPPGLPDDRFVFCCFSNHYKITEPMFARLDGHPAPRRGLRPVAGRGQRVVARQPARARGRSRHRPGTIAVRRPCRAGQIHGAAGAGRSVPGHLPL